MQGWNFENFLTATKVLLQNKQAILKASQSVEETLEVVYHLIVSVLQAYEALKFGTYSRAIPNEDACAVIEAYGNE